MLGCVRGRLIPILRRGGADFRLEFRASPRHAGTTGTEGGIALRKRIAPVVALVLASASPAAAQETATRTAPPGRCGWSSPSRLAAASTSCRAYSLKLFSPGSGERSWWRTAWGRAAMSAPRRWRGQSRTAITLGALPANLFTINRHEAPWQRQRQPAASHAWQIRSCWVHLGRSE